MSEQSHEKKQLQFGDAKELAVLTNYPNFNNINNNQLYQKTDFSNLSFMNNVKQYPKSMVAKINLIGEGAFANVYEGYIENEHGKEKVAIKVSFLLDFQMIDDFDS